MAREKINYESMSARFPLGTLSRIDKVLVRYEGKADFVREAVLTKLKIREGYKRRKGGDPENPEDYVEQAQPVAG